VNSLVHNGVLIIAFIIIGANMSLAEIKLAGKSFFARHYAGISLRDLDTAWSLISNFNGLPKLHPVIIYCFNKMKVCLTLKVLNS
jgi:hypothetical protein